MSKFKTTNPALFTNNNQSVMPDWMQSLSDNLQYNEKEKINLDFDKKGAFATSVIIDRPDLDASPREMTANLNNDKFELDSKVELAKFLKGKYYKTKARIASNNIYMDTTIDGIQANFTFRFNYTNGRVVRANTFIINDSEYPFSEAGFQESLQDIKTGNLKKSTTKVASSRETFVINREEIIRRYNGHLREATNVINEHITTGVLVGVGSNAYATYYDPNELFPQIQKEIPQLPTGSFEFVNNTEHVATNECKSAKSLSLQASKLLSKLFPDYIINNAIRDNNELLVDAVVLNGSTGIRNRVNFDFIIENEKVASIRLAEINNERMTIEELIHKLNSKNNLVDDYLKNATASKRIHSGAIITHNELTEKLSPLVGDDRTNDFINAWISLNAIYPLSGSSYVTNNTIEELLNMITAEGLSDKEKIKIANYKKSFGSGLDFDRIEQEDTGVREVDDVELTQELKLAKVNNELSKHFKNYQITGFNDDIISAQFINNGVRHTLRLAVKFNNRKLEKVSTIINNNKVSLNDLIKAFKVSPLLSSYLQTNASNNFSNNIIATEHSLLERLSKITADADVVLAKWKKDYLKSIGGSLYSSQYSFEELLNKTTASLLSDEDKRQIMIAKQHFGHEFDRIVQADTGVRDPENYVSNEKLLYEANRFISQNFNNYIPKNFKSTDKTANYVVSLFDDNTGLSTDINFMFNFNDSRVASCHANINGNLIELSNIKKAFAMNEALSRYLQSNSGKKFNAPMVITKNDLLNRLASITNAEKTELQDVINNWQSYGKINQLSENTYASKLSLEQLISMSNIKPLTDNEIAAKLDRARRDRGLTITSSHINDSDTRRPEEIWSGEQMALRGRTTIGNMFADFDIINAEIGDNNFIITARIINPLNGLKKALQFKFDTLNGKKLGILASISDGEKEVDSKNILDLLKSTDDAINKFISLNSVSNKNYKNIISKSNLKSKLSSLNNKDEYINMENYLVTAGMLNPIDNFNFASEYSFSDIIEYLSNNNKLDLKIAENNIRTYGKDNAVNTDGPIVMETDSRQLEKPVEILSPKMIETATKIRKLISSSYENKKITTNKINQLNSMLEVAKSSNDIEIIWRELKKYL